MFLFCSSSQKGENGQEIVVPEDNTKIIDQSPPAMVFDAARYQHLLDDPAISVEESETFLRAMWDLIVMLIDFGLRVEFQNIDPQPGTIRSKELDAAIGDMLKSEHSVSIDKKVPDRELLGAREKCADE